MRAITITYQYDGPETEWRETIDAFIAAIESDAALQGRFSYQVAIADDGRTRVHWGRWETAKTLTHLQAQDYFKTFAGQIKAFAGETLCPVGHEVVTKTNCW